MSARESERALDLFGSRVRLLAGVPRQRGTRPTELLLAEAEASLRSLHRRLSRFDPESELSRLNRDEREVVPVSRALAAFVSVAIECARRSGGLVDPTVLGALESSGYATSRIGAAPADLGSALAAAPPRAPAAPDPRRLWDEVHADPAAGTVSRPPGVRIDSGGVAKGYAADMLARRFAGHSSFCVDCGGDLRLGGVDDLPRDVVVPSPFPGRRGIRLSAVSGGIATSGVSRGIWARGSAFGHHLIDPARGTPAWTGIVQVTALAPTATEAEVRAKQALLAGPAGARRLLAAGGGVVVHDDGEFELLGALARPREVAA